MGIQEILSQEDGKKIRLYKRGLFWVAYEQSALLLCTKKALQVRAEGVKAAGKVVVRVGFPEQTRAFFSGIFGEFISTDERSGYWALDPAAGPPDFAALRRTYVPEPEEPLQAVGSGSKPAERVLKAIRAYPLAEKTPLEAMLFIKDMQAVLQSAEKRASDGHL